ncbi:leucine-rich repeat domain-containing protein, partial [Listeria innocua]|nr:KxYKxGKxW signal peptide domain-containing protein [Listeria innocua]EKK9480763.1 KxYKxGKxW signal peptide domain-containing protein [Listeria innocua]EKM0706111.1 KxYKxGKxW signal peptide domain-containing protein [Listeria innocua]EKM6484495.1 KxYKxGKxW signal peptide domain-containing protein [Listeria innocua]
MRFTRKAREQKQKNWRMWKKGKQWLCGAVLFFTVVSSPGMTVLAAEGNAVETSVTVGRQVAAKEPPPEEVVKKESEEDSKINENKSPSAGALKQTQESKNSEQATNTESKEAPTKLRKAIPGPTAISSIFPDANLAEVMRTQFGKSSVDDTVTQAELDSCTFLNVSFKNIIDVTGIENLRELTYLDIGNNKIVDISPVAGLVNLYNMRVDGNKELSDISPVANMPSLTHFYMHNCAISDISPVSNLTGMQVITLSNNKLSDISPLANLTNLVQLTADGNMIENVDVIANLNKLFTLKLDNNKISDVSSLSGYTGAELYINNNKISDISSLSGFNGFIRAGQQKITLPAMDWNNPINITSIIKDKTGNLVTPSSVGSGGSSVGPSITWSIPNATNQVSYQWSEISSAAKQNFSGKVSIGVNQIHAVHILIDDDGDSNTTGDQTLLGEEINTVSTAEAKYNYAKAQLDGTDYGLVDIQINDLDYTIIVSKVGALKKVDSEGASITADVSYTPTYQVTGTGDAAQLSASYEVTIDAPPSGFVYVYEKGTAQEKRYTTNTPVTIPNTDVNGNGVSDWRDNYTVVKYKKAGNLNPVGPGGTPIPGGVIATPDESIKGDIITVPDKITGTDGKEYTVDPSVDRDPNNPGVQITLEDEDQDVPYLDVALSESESTSLSESESTSLSESESMSLSESESTSLSESESMSLSESESMSLSESESTSLSESESTSLSESESTSLSESESMSLSESESTSLSESESTSLSESESTSLSESESTSLSESESTSLSESESISLSESESTSLSESESMSLSESESMSLSESESTSLSESESTSLSESESTSLSESESTSLSESESISLSESESMSLSESESMSLSESESASLSESESMSLSESEST